MILIIRPTKISNYQSCQTTPCKSYCPWKMNNDLVFSQYLENNNRKKLSIAEMILMISTTEVFFRQSCWTTPCKSISLERQNLTRWVIQAPESLLFYFSRSFVQEGAFVHMHLTFIVIYSAITCNYKIVSPAS